jgi:hypothetical protein
MLDQGNEWFLGALGVCLMLSMMQYALLAMPF